MSVVEHLQHILDQQEEVQAELRAKRLQLKRQEQFELPKQRQVKFQVVM